MASGYAVLEAKRDAGANELAANALVADMETSEGRSAAQDGLKAQLTGKSPAEIKQQAIATLTRVGQILDAKAPAEAAGLQGMANACRREGRGGIYRKRLPRLRRRQGD